MNQQVLLLMAGSSSVFEENGSTYPKNLVEISGTPLVEHVLAGVRPLIESGARITCLVRADENARYYTSDVIKLLVPEARVVEVPAETRGAACTALLAIEEVMPDQPLLILNGDQVITRDLSAIVSGFDTSGVDGGIVVFRAVHPRWSYVRIDAEGRVVEAAEKRPISNLATAGAYWFRRASSFTEAAMSMISKGASVDGLYYVCPAYNELVLAGSHVSTHEVDRDEYISLASPHGVAEYELLLESRRAAR